MDKLKTKVQNIDWWEIGYLILYGAIFTYSFLDTTMFEIKWPPRFGYIFLISSALFTVAKFIWHNTYTKKETIWAAIILGAFIISGIVADYSFLIWTGFLIVGAKDVDFDKILKVYLTIGITIMLAAFVASQMGWIENLVFHHYMTDHTIYRQSYGSVYPTDFAAHVFYLAVAGVSLSEDKISWGKIINFIVLGLFVYDKCDAKTSFICLTAMAVMLIFVRYFKKVIKGSWLYYIVNYATLGFCLLYLGLARIYDASKEWMIKLNDVLSQRLQLTEDALDLYQYKLFGQNIVEVGFGRNNTEEIEYFFIDDSYIRIALLYGIVLLVVVMCIINLNGVKAIKSRRVIMVFAIAVIGLHSFMEHHLLEVAYNPFLFIFFANCAETLTKDKLEDF